MDNPTFHTAEMVRAIPDDRKRYETVHGELLVTTTQSPWHQEIVGRIASELDAYVEGQPVGLVLFSPSDISWGPDTLVQPDVFVVDREEARTWEWSLMRTLLLAVEVTSPATAIADRFTKRCLYQKSGVATYWLVDPDAHFVEVWTPGDIFPETVRDTLRWQPAGANVPLVLELPELFRDR
jgi:Uma2 family endonuclease